MRLRVLFFGILRERLGRREDAIELPEGARVADLMAELAGRHDVFQLGAGSLRVAVNQDYVDDEHVLRDGDEAAIIPPVSGGSGAGIQTQTRRTRS